jgi:glucose dehydrogenase
MVGLASKLALGVACAALAATSTAVSTADGALGATDWPSTNYDHTANRYSPLTQITAKNVGALQQVWSFHLKQPMRLIQREDGSYVNSGPLAGTRRFGDPDRKLLCGPTPWGELVAVNMDTGNIAYRKTLGVSDALPAGLQDTGRPSSGGVVLTASGLTFVGGTDDFRFRAFATASGEKLWEIKLPSSIETTPITYQGADGRQFVTVVSTGGGLTGSQVTNDEIIAFALPKK